MSKKILFSFMVITFLGILGNLFLAIKLRNVEAFTREVLELQGTMELVGDLGEILLDEKSLAAPCLRGNDSTACAKLNGGSVRWARDIEALRATHAFREEAVRTAVNSVIEEHNAFLGQYKTGRAEVGSAVLDRGLTRLGSRIAQLQEDRIVALESGMALVNRTIVGVILLMGFIAAALCVYITRGVLGPLRRLLHASRMIGQGQFDQMTDVGKADEEIAEVIEAFQEMARKLEKFQAHQAEMERLKAAGAIAAGVSHEVNNPLTVITGTAEFLKTTRGEKDAEIREAMAVVLEEAERISNITQKLSHLKQFVVEDYSLQGGTGQTSGRLLDIAGSAEEEKG